MSALGNRITLTSEADIGAVFNLVGTKGFYVDGKTHPVPLIVMAILLRGTEVLLARRSPHRAAHANLWSFPGGHVEKGEAPAKALNREIFEEIGVTPLDHVLVYRITATTGEVPIIFELYAVRRWDGEPQIRDDEHTEIRWFDLAEAALLPSLALKEYRPLFASLRGSEP